MDPSTASVWAAQRGGLKTKIQFSFTLLFCVDKTLEKIWRQDFDNTVKEVWNEQRGGILNKIMSFCFLIF